MGWRRALQVVFLTMIVSACGTKPRLSKIDTNGFTYQGTDVYFEGTLIAVLKSNEIGHDNNKIVREITYEIVEIKHQDKALSLVKFLHDLQPEYDVQVEVCATKVIAPTK
jgi:hypothetical protein